MWRSAVYYVESALVVMETGALLRTVERHSSTVTFWFFKIFIFLTAFTSGFYIWRTWVFVRTSKMRRDGRGIDFLCLISSMIFFFWIPVGHQGSGWNTINFKSFFYIFGFRICTWAFSSGFVNFLINLKL